MHRGFPSKHSAIVGLNVTCDLLLPFGLEQDDKEEPKIGAEIFEPKFPENSILGKTKTIYFRSSDQTTKDHTMVLHV